MNKGDLIAKIQDEADLTKAQAESALNTVLDTISSALSEKENVQLVGFGTFSISERSAREGRNPQTGKTIQIAAKNVVKFKPGKKLTEMVQE
ncbi:MAG: HU family DNA-binding protein [Saprospiraceae bacterium]